MAHMAVNDICLFAYNNITKATMQTDFHEI